MFDWHKKESPILSILGMGGGIGSKLIGGLGEAIVTTSGSVTPYTPGDGYQYYVYDDP